MKSPLLRAAGVLFALLLSVNKLTATVIVSQPYRGITLIKRTETLPRPENMNIVQIDLTDPDIHFKLSPANPPSPNTFNSETRVQRTLDYMNQERAQMAVNVHFFDNPPQNNSGTNLTGIAASLGNVYSAFDPSPVLNYALVPNAPALNIDTNNHAVIATRGGTDTSLVNGVDSVTPYNTLSGSAQIIANGANSCPTNLPPRPGGTVSFYFDQVAARTAVGLSQDGNTLFLFTVDAAGGSQGMTVNEMANFLMTEYGVYNALNLDGGGSTSLALLDPFTNVGGLVNAQSNGASARLVGTSLAIFAVPEPGSLGLIIGGAGFLLAIRRRRAGLAMIILFTGSTLVGQARAALVPYSQDFESINIGDPLSAAVLGNATASANTWLAANSSGNHVYQNVLSASGSNSAKGFSSLQFTNLGPASPANNFEISAILSPVSVSSPGSVNYTAGLRFLGSTASSTDDCYVADLNFGANAGRMRIVEFTGATATVLPSPTQSLQPLVPNYSSSNSYLLDVLGTYDLSNALTMKFTITEVGNPANTQSYTLSTDTTPRTGQYFGFYDSFGANGVTMTANYDNFVVAPEPSSMSCLLAGITCLFELQRRRRITME